MPTRVSVDKPRKPWRCFDCGSPVGEYIVRDAVWVEAWPDYPEFKREMMRKYKGTPDDRLRHLLLCLGCLEKRLERLLVPEDFDLDLSVNAGIRLGLRMAKEGLVMGEGKKTSPWSPRGPGSIEEAADV